MAVVRVAVVGLGGFGRHHLRICDQMPDVELVAAVDIDPVRAQEAAAQYSCRALTDSRDLIGLVEAAVVAVPTVAHYDVARPLLEAGIDVLIEKPITPDLASAQQLVEVAAKNSTILQVGHLERFNPAIEALRKAITVPLFFEIHRLSVFTPRSLDIDVVLYVMSHDIDLLLSLTGMLPSEIRAAGISILSQKVDIANVRIAFPNGCVANLTASRVSTERVRKLRLFQPHQYISLDYEKQEAVAFTVSGGRQIGFQPLTVDKEEPLKRELLSFFQCVRTRRTPRVSGSDALSALRACREILDKIEEHAQIVTATLSASNARP